MKKLLLCGSAAALTLALTGCVVPADPYYAEPASGYVVETPAYYGGYYQHAPQYRNHRHGHGAWRHKKQESQARYDNDRHH